MNFIKTSLIVSTALILCTWSARGQNLPDNPVPGKCYAKCITQDEYEDRTETVVVSPEYRKLKVIPATYKTVEDRVLIKEATKKMTYVPAIYETVEVDFVAKEKRTDLEVVPAVFGKDAETIETAPKYGRWEYTLLDDCPSANKEDCMVACFVEYPNQEEQVAKTTLVSDASTKDIPVNELKDKYKKQIIKEPAKIIEEEIPAEYATIKRQVIDQPARVEEEIVPAVTKTVNTKVLSKKGGETVWEEIDCSLVGNANILPILYPTNSAELTPTAKQIINDNLLKLMNEKAALRIEIMSHTDARGNDEYNLDLSQRRAQSVVDYLVSKGISKTRLVAKGYGETRLKNRCSNGVDCSASEHQVNRRTEFRIIQ